MKTQVAVVGILLSTQTAVAGMTLGEISDNTIFNLPTIDVGMEMASLKTDLLNSELARAMVGNQTIFIGTEQVSVNNQNPFAISFIDNTVQWFVDDYETGAPDSRGVGIVWDGSNEFYSAFRVDGGGSGIESLAINGWLNSFDVL